MVAEKTFGYFSPRSACSASHTYIIFPADA